MNFSVQACVETAFLKNLRLMYGWMMLQRAIFLTNASQETGFRFESGEKFRFAYGMRPVLPKRSINWSNKQRIKER